jgi:hypothetical protein
MALLVRANNFIRLSFINDISINAISSLLYTREQVPSM